MTRKSLLSMMVLATVAIPAAAQEAESDWLVVDGEAVETRQLSNDGVEAKAVTANCSGGVVYDDGTLNSGYGLSAGGQRAGAVMRFDLPGGTTSLDQACICLSRSAGAPSSMNFDLVVYDNNGSGGSPGTLIRQQAVTANGISTAPTFFNVNLTGLGVTVPDNNVFVGILWPSLYSSGTEAIYICGDTSGALTQRTNFFSATNGGSWAGYSTFFPASPGNNPRALGIRVDPHAAVAGCTPTASAMCLNNNRFKVEAQFATIANPGLSPAFTVKLVDDSGYLWFFNANNIELVVKVLNACGVNSRYWVFAAGLTNVRVDLTVTDTATGAVKTYFNPLNQPYQPLQDTTAFATCP